MEVIRTLRMNNPKAQMHQFSHCSADACHFGFATGEHTFINCLDVRVVAFGIDCRQVE